MERKIRFGPSGNDVLFYAQKHKTSVEAPAWLASMGLSAYEVNFGRGVKMGDKMADELGAEGRKHNISISVHAPYYINLANPDPEAFKKSYQYIEKCMEIVKKIDSSDGPVRIIIHIGSQCDLPREVAIQNCKNALRKVIANLKSRGFSDFLLCIETMGRYRAIGTYQEICDICKIDPCVIPVLDFGHINCLEQGELGRNDGRMREIVDYCIEQIGIEKMERVHIHFSAVEYTERGEHAHSTLDNPRWSFPFGPFARVISEKNLAPIIICESEDIMAQDAKKLHEIWAGLKK